MNAPQEAQSAQNADMRETRRDALDDRDAQILARRYRAITDARAYRRAPVCGDYITFPDGSFQRVSHLWDDGAQTSHGGSWYLGNGYASFSGALNPPVPYSALTLTNETRMGSCWFFHHDHFQAHNGVNVQIPFAVWTCAVPQAGDYGRPT